MSQEEGGQKPSGIVITLEDVAKKAGAPPTYGPAPAPAGPPAAARPETAQAKTAGAPAGFWLRLAAKLIDLAR
jgi:hypothetical protein